MPPEKLRVHAEFVGGGFGSKFEPGSEAFAAVKLAQVSKAPVKVMLNRFRSTCVRRQPAFGDHAHPRGRRRRGQAQGLGLAVVRWSGLQQGRRPRDARAQDLSAAKTRNEHVDLETFTDRARAMRAPGCGRATSRPRACSTSWRSWPGSTRSRSASSTTTTRCACTSGSSAPSASAGRSASIRSPARRARASHPARRGSRRRLGQMGGTGNGVTCRIHQDTAPSRRERRPGHRHRHEDGARLARRRAWHRARADQGDDGPHARTPSALPAAAARRRRASHRRHAMRPTSRTAGAARASRKRCASTSARCAARAARSSRASAR